MVFGLFEGNKIDIQVDKPHYQFGEEVTGKVVLDMKGTKKANQVAIQLYFEYVIMVPVVKNMGNPPRQVNTTDARTQRTMAHVLSLDGKKEYGPGHFEYPFKFTLQNTQIAGGYMRANGWYLDASLDVPLSVDVSKRVLVNVN